MTWQLSEEQITAYKPIEKAQEVYGKEVAKIILSLPAHLQQGAMFSASDCAYEVIMELTLLVHENRRKEPK